MSCVLLGAGQLLDGLVADAEDRGARQAVLVLLDALLDELLVLGAQAARRAAGRAVHRRSARFDVHHDPVELSSSLSRRSTASAMSWASSTGQLAGHPMVSSAKATPAARRERMS